MKTNYYQVVDMTKEEKITMYMKYTKRELIEMLLENQDLLMQSIMRNNNFTDKSSWPPPYNEAINTVTNATDKVNAAKYALAQKMGYTSWSAMTTAAALGGNLITPEGLINAEVMDVGALAADAVNDCLCRECDSGGVG